jgi:hypothetical protein
MPRKTEIIDTFYQGVKADGTVVAESKFRNTVKRKMRHHPDGEIQERNLVGYFTPWTASPEPKEADK